ncbi:MAG TPA: transcriptional regulator [Nitrospirota bacterium]
MMRDKSREPAAPPETQDTVRHAIVAELQQGPCSARDLSASVGISEREVQGHLEHIQKSILSLGLHLIVRPAECKKCGFVFAKREKLKRPGKCPVCRGESIRDPRYEIRERDRERV